MSLQDSVRSSYWESDTLLRGADIVVAGAGITGLNTAIALKQFRPEFEVLVIERGPFSTGASTRNAGFACFGSPSEILADIRDMGEEQSLELIRARKMGLDHLLELTGARSIDYRRTGGAEIFLEHDGEFAERCRSIVPVLNKELNGVWSTPPFRIPAGGVSTLTGALKCQAIEMPHEGHLHPGKLIVRLTRIAQDVGVRFLFGLEVDHVEDTGSNLAVYCGRRTISCRILGVATNGFALQLLDGVEVTPARNQVYLSREMEQLPVNGCIHYNEGYVYSRDVGKRLLIGGARNVALANEATDAFGLTDDIGKWIENFAIEELGCANIDFEYEWSGILGIGPSKSPIVAMTSKRIGVGVRLGGMGVALGSMVGKKLAELLLRHY